MECQNLFAGKNIRNTIINLSPAEFAQMEVKGERANR